MYYRFEEEKKKRLKKDEEIKNKERIYPYLKIEPGVVKAYSTEIVGYVIDLYTINDYGYIYMNFMEEKGTRNAEIEIPVKEILKSDVFNSNIF
jgi:hypothetical protein